MDHSTTRTVLIWALALAAGASGTWNRVSEWIGGRAPAVAGRWASAASYALLIAAVAGLTWLTLAFARVV